MTLSSVIAEHVASVRFEQLSPKTIAATRYSLLDALGVMLGASGVGEGCDSFVQVARESKATPESMVLGYGFHTSASLAAFANGSMAHALDFEDAHDEGPVHPNAQTIPAALALAEALGTVTGKDLITALAVGCDLVSRLGKCLTRSLDEYGWYPPPILGAFGATAAAARLLNFNSRQILDAMSLTLCQVGCSAELKYNPTSVVRSIRDAFAAQSGVQSAQLAAKGVRGFDQPFEGKAGFFNNFARGHFDESVLVKDLGVRFEGENLSFKPWPACRGTHAYIDAALELRRRHALEPSTIVRARLIGHSVQRMLVEPAPQKRKPQTAIDAKFSLPFTVATALRNGKIDLESFSSAALVDASILSLAEKISFELSTDLKASNNATRGTLEIELSDGTKHGLHIEHPLGHPSRPMSEADLTAKFRHCASYARNPITDANLASLTDSVLTLERHDDLSKDLFGLLS